jgi:putative DNA methylase
LVTPSGNCFDRLRRPTVSSRGKVRSRVWVIMPNHVHVLLTPLPGWHLDQAEHSIKSYTANEANKVLKRKGQFWAPECFDRYIRDWRHFDAVIRYIENNPVKARLCKRPEDWPFSSAALEWKRA